MLIRAVVFNLCGTLVNLRPFRFRAVAEAFRAADIDGNWEPAVLEEQFTGADDLTIVTSLASGKRIDPEKILPVCWQVEKSLGEKLTVAMDRGELHPYGGAVELLKELSGRNIPVAAVSETSTAIARMVLRRVLGMESDAVAGMDTLNDHVWDYYMARVVKEISGATIKGSGRKDVSHHLLWTVDPERSEPFRQDVHTPFPDRRYYETALVYLDTPVKPDEVVVFEDSVKNGAVAKAAGYQTILVTHSSRREDLQKVTGRVLDGMPESLDVLTRLFGMEFQG